MKGSALSSASMTNTSKRSSKDNGLTENGVTDNERNKKKAIVSEQRFENLYGGRKDMMMSESDSDSETLENGHQEEVSKMANNEETANNKSKMADHELYKHTDKGLYYVIGESQNIDEFNL